MPLYASPPPFVWHKIETVHLTYSAAPTFVPPTPPVLVPPPNPFAPPPEPEPEKEPEPTPSNDEKKDNQPEAEAPVAEEAPPTEPGTCLASL